MDTEADYEKAWKEFDPTLKSSITAAQFRQLMAGLGTSDQSFWVLGGTRLMRGANELVGENVSDGEVEELINSVDGEDRISCMFPLLAPLYMFCSRFKLSGKDLASGALPFGGCEMGSWRKRREMS